MMPLLQQMPNGQYMMTVSKKIVDAQGWKPGIELMYMNIGPYVQPQSGDVILRPTGY
ncbi:MAG: hypothetical protein KAT48_10740 [Bacteroidales bacterium]|jgi:hypothetical protein|nr:hypothetical protein [Bacteroidales bacterium]